MSALTAANAAATTDVPEPPLQDQQIVNMASPIESLKSEGKFGDLKFKHHNVAQHDVGVPPSEAVTGG